MNPSSNKTLTCQDVNTGKLSIIKNSEGDKNKCKILYITGMYPHDDNNMSGIFITRRLNELKSEYGLKFRAIAPVPKFNSTIARFYEKISKKHFSNVTHNKNKEYYNYIFYDLKFIDYIYRLLNKGEYGRLLAKKFLAEIEKKIDIRSYNLTHVHWAFPTGLIAYYIKKKYGIPYILTVHGSDIHTYPQKNKTIKKYTLKVLENADKVIFVSNYLRETAKQMGYNCDTDVVIPNGVDLKIFKPINKDEAKKRLGLSLGNKYVGFVGNLIPIKNAQLLPDIFLSIKNKTQNSTSFLVIGDGVLKTDIENKCKQANLDVVFTGRIASDDVALGINALDVLILPSKKEGWPSVILEAQACGVPVVGSDAGGIPEAIGGTDYGRIVELGVNFVERFSEAVAEMLSDRLMPEKIHERALEYSWSKIVSKEISVHNEVIRK